MGCDIHLYVEKRVDGQWVTCDHWEEEVDEDSETGVYKFVPYGKAFYSGRNYELFAILANVRNDSGMVPIAPPRGIPDDACEEVKSCAAHWDVDGHSHSWFTVAELLAYDWTQTTTLEGWVALPTYYEFTQRSDPYERPDSYSGGVAGVNVVHLKSYEANVVIEQATSDFERLYPELKDNYWQLRRRLPDYLERHHPSTYVHTTWETPYYYTVRDFTANLLPRLWALGKPEDVRIVFWFDN